MGSDDFGRCSVARCPLAVNLASGMYRVNSNHERPRQSDTQIWQAGVQSGLAETPKNIRIELDVPTSQDHARPPSDGATREENPNLRFVINQSGVTGLDRSLYLTTPIQVTEAPERSAADLRPILRDLGSDHPGMLRLKHISAFRDNVPGPTSSDSCFSRRFGSTRPRGKELLGHSDIASTALPVETWHPPRRARLD